MVSQQVKRRIQTKEITDNETVEPIKPTVKSDNSETLTQWKLTVLVLLVIIGVLLIKNYCFEHEHNKVIRITKAPIIIFSANEDKYYNEQDKLISKHLKRGFSLLDKNQISKSLSHFEMTLSKYPDSPLSQYGIAASLDRLADEKRSNELLQKSIDAYITIPDVKDSPLALIKVALNRAIERLTFLGKTKLAIKTAEVYVEHFPNDALAWNKLGVQQLIFGLNSEAEKTFRKALEISPINGFSKSHLAFVLKSQSNFNESIPLFEEGINSYYEGADDAKFYFHLGDAYTRTGKPDEAHRVYAEAAKKGLFLSAWQRSLYNADTELKAQPWWEPIKTPYAKYFKILEENWKTIRDEGLSILDMQKGGFVPEEENLSESGDWLQFTLYQQGKKKAGNCRRTPKTCKILDSMPDATGCKRGQIKYSVMHPGTHIWPHCGPTNCRIRSHLGLIIPDGVSIRCGQTKRTWKEGKTIIIDDSFEHEVWHNGTSLRLILIVDFWHPGLTQQQRNALSPI